jgi:hypothetical protein
LPVDARDGDVLTCPTSAAHSAVPLLACRANMCPSKHPTYSMVPFASTVALETVLSAWKVHRRAPLEFKAYKK